MIEIAKIWPDVEFLLPEDSSVRRLYFGSETCERLLPEQFELRKAMDLASRFGFNLTLLTPVLSDIYIDRALGLFEIFSGFPLAEVVVSAWGTLEALRDFDITPVIGRMLSKQKRGPEIINQYEYMPKIQKEISANVGFSSDLVRFARSMGAYRFELDPLAKGAILNLDNDARGSISISMHASFSLVSISRFCMTATFHNGQARPPHAWSCERQCRLESFILSSHKMPRPLILEGNTLFMEQADWESQADAIGADRIILPAES